jgi:hypothetical protein
MRKNVSPAAPVKSIKGAKLNYVWTMGAVASDVFEKEVQGGSRQRLKGNLAPGTFQGL